MSRDIDLNKPLSKEDKAYLRSRTREHEILVNERQFGPNGEGVIEDKNKDGEINILDIDEDIANHVLGLSEEQLKDKLAKAGIDSQVDPESEDSHRDQMVEALAIHYQLNRNEKKAEKAAQEAANAERAKDTTK